MLRQRGPLKSGLVFHREDGSPLYQSRMNQQHAAIRTLLKFPLECVPHSFRHTYGTRLGEAGVDAFTIMRLMRHSSVTISQRYVHPTGEAMERAVARLEALNEGKMEEVPQVIPQVEKAKYRGKQLTHQFSTRPGWRNWQTQRT